MNGTITDVPGILVGHAQNETARTGCTVILPPPAGTMAGLCSTGAAPATRELDLLRIDGITREVHAVLLTGGSAFGLAAADGVMSWLEKRQVGFDAAVARVPLVPTLSLFDLATGDPAIRPDAAMARRACKAATADAVPQGCTGVGCGATVGKALGIEKAARSGVGSASAVVSGIRIGALAVSNAFGDIRDAGGAIVAGIGGHSADDPADSYAVISESREQRSGDFANCTFAVVALEAALDRRSANRVAEMAMAGISRTVHPAHTSFDFDAVIVLACGDQAHDPLPLGAAAGQLVARALVSGVRAAAHH